MKKVPFDFNEEINKGNFNNFWMVRCSLKIFFIIFPEYSIVFCKITLKTGMVTNNFDLFFKIAKSLDFVKLVI